MMISAVELLVKLGFTDSRRQAKTWIKEGAFKTEYLDYDHETGGLFRRWERVGGNYDLEYKDRFRLGHRIKEVSGSLYDYFLEKYSPKDYLVDMFCRARNPVVEIKKDGVQVVDWDKECGEVCLGGSISVSCPLYEVKNGTC